MSHATSSKGKLAATSLEFLVNTFGRTPRKLIIEGSSVWPGQWKRGESSGQRRKLKAFQFQCYFQNNTVKVQRTLNIAFFSSCSCRRGDAYMIFYTHFSVLFCVLSYQPLPLFLIQIRWLPAWQVFENMLCSEISATVLYSEAGTF